jgi:hypothetical protein
LAGVTTIELNVTAVTVSVVLPETELKVAEIVALPEPTPVARPAALIVALLLFDEAQVTVLVKFTVDPFE